MPPVSRRGRLAAILQRRSKFPPTSPSFARVAALGEVRVVDTNWQGVATWATDDGEAGRDSAGTGPASRRLPVSRSRALPHPSRKETGQVHQRVIFTLGNAF